MHQTGSWPGWDIARGITLVTNTSGYVLDGYGGLAPFYATGTPEPTVTKATGYDAASTDPFTALAYSPATRRGIDITRFDPATGTTNVGTFSGS